MQPSDSLTALTRDQIRDVLVHEIAHLERGDQRIVMLQAIAKAAFWPIPFVHLLNRELDRAREEVCDTYVLIGRDALSYGQTLLRVAELACGARPLAQSVGVRHGGGELENRINRIHARKSKVTHIRPLTAAAILGLFLSSSALMSGTTTVAAQSAGNPFVSRAVPARQQRLAAFRDEPSVENLRKLLQSNDDDTAIDALGNHHGGIRTFQQIVQAGHGFTVAIARKIAQPAPQGYTAGYTVAFFFDEQGNLAQRLGGNVSEDQAHGDDVWLTLLGTPDKWFAAVQRRLPVSTARNDSARSCDREVDVYLVDDGFPLAVRVNHHANGIAWTNTVDEASMGSYFVFSRPLAASGTPGDVQGVGRDNLPYAPRLRWDRQQGEFLGPGYLQAEGEALFLVDERSSQRFAATDRNLPAPTVGMGTALPAPLERIALDLGPLGETFEVEKIELFAKGEFLTPDPRPRKVQEETLVWTLVAKQDTSADGLRNLLLGGPRRNPFPRVRFTKTVDNAEVGADAREAGYVLFPYWNRNELRKGYKLTAWTTLGREGTAGLLERGATKAVILVPTAATQRTM